MAVESAARAVVNGQMSPADYEAIWTNIGNQAVAAPGVTSQVKGVTVTSREQATQSAADPSVKRVFFGGKTYRRVNQ
jgi:hypothetical protein